MPVIYVDRRGRKTDAFTGDMQAHVTAIESNGGRIVSTVPNSSATETIGVWIFWSTTN